MLETTGDLDFDKHLNFPGITTNSVSIFFILSGGFADDTASPV